MAVLVLCNQAVIVYNGKTTYAKSCKPEGYLSVYVGIGTNQKEEEVKAIQFTEKLDEKSNDQDILDAYLDQEGVIGGRVYDDYDGKQKLQFFMQCKWHDGMAAIGGREVIIPESQKITFGIT